MKFRGSALRYHVRDVEGYSYGFVIAHSEQDARDFIYKTLGPRQDYSFERCGCIILDLKEAAQWADVLLPDIIHDHHPRLIKVHVTEVVWSRKGPITKIRDKKLDG